MTRPAEWMPIETAPKDGTLVFVYGYDEYSYDLRFDDGVEIARHPFPATFQNDIWWLSGEIIHTVEEPTHWMPLPAPPESGK